MTRASRCRPPGPTTRLKVDDKKQPVWKHGGPRGGADDLDKAKNTNAVELASLTAMKLGVGDPYPAWEADDKGTAHCQERPRNPRSVHPELQARGRRQRSGHRSRPEDV